MTFRFVSYNLLWFKVYFVWYYHSLIPFTAFLLPFPIFLLLFGFNCFFFVVKCLNPFLISSYVYSIAIFWWLPWGLHLTFWSCNTLIWIYINLTLLTYTHSSFPAFLPPSLVVVVTKLHLDILYTPRHKLIII